MRRYNNRIEVARSKRLTENRRHRRIMENRKARPSKRLTEALIEVDDDDLLDMFDERVGHWTDDREVAELYHKMYENLIDGGVFEGQRINIMEIVDNDYINWCDVIAYGDDEYDEVANAYDAGDWETDHGIVEAEIEDSEGRHIFLVRR